MWRIAEPINLFQYLSIWNHRGIEVDYCPFPSKKSIHKTNRAYQFVEFVVEKERLAASDINLVVLTNVLHDGYILQVEAIVAAQRATIRA